MKESSVARKSWTPAFAERMSAATTEPELVPDRSVNGAPCEVPRLTEPGDPPVIRPPTTRDPAGTDAVDRVRFKTRSPALQVAAVGAR